MPTRTMFTRRRSESMRSVADSITPADELSSWLPDDVCTTCGSGVHAGQLYCSQECRDEDAQSTNASTSESTRTKPSTSAPAFQALGQSKPARISSGDKLDRTRSSIAGKAEPRSFRYACPPSPHILAKYGAHLTSPALAAWDRRPQANAGASEKEWTSSSELSMTKRRSSSRSTYSSASDALSTDPSTPSPLISRTAMDELDDLESSDFNLPPSVFPSAVVMLKTGTRDGAPKARRSPQDKKTALPAVSQQQQPVPKRDSMTTMAYARRPSRTNLPAPVMFTSPVLATTTMKASVNAPRRDSRVGLSMSSSWQHRVGRKSPSQSSNEVGTKRNSIATAMPVGSARTASAQFVRKSANTPPQAASASSSAGKTLRALSPASAAISLSPDFSGFPVCGRFGCQGFSSGTESTLPQDTRDSLTSLGHKHTHSASAKLNLLGQTQETRSNVAGHSLQPSASGATAAARLKMTPLLGAKADLPLATSCEEDGIAAELDRNVRSPPRGRSKARGRSSTSRRSPSPPRGVARRGRSEDLLYMKNQPPVSPKSSSIRMPRTSPHHIEAVSDADDEDESEDREPRRGRSLTERSGRMQQRRSGVVAPSLDKSDLRRANDNAGASQLDSLGSVMSSLSAKEASGYDEVDLDGL